MGDIVKIKHLIWTIGGMLVFAFSLGLNVNSKLVQVETNTNDIEVLRSNQTSNDKEQDKNHKEVMNALHRLELQLKDKKDRE